MGSLRRTQPSAVRSDASVTHGTSACQLPRVKVTASLPGGASVSCLEGAGCDQVKAMIDNHCHPFVLRDVPLDLSDLSLDIDEGDAASENRRAIGPWRMAQELIAVRLARYLGCDIEEVDAARTEASRDWQRYVSSLFADAGITDLVMDPSWPPGAADRLEEYSTVCGCSIHPMLRLEPIVDAAIEEGGTAAETVDAVLARMRSAATDGYVAFKSILAYRTGLAVDPDATMRQAERSIRGDGPARRRGKALRDLLLRRALGVAADLGLPFQIHTGIGDSEIRIAESDPLLLEELLRTPEGRAARVVLIHGSYPWHEQLGYLALTKANVWADISLFTLFSPVTSGERLLRILDIAPATKVLLATDGNHQPELFWFGAHVLRDAWGQASAEMRAAGARDPWLEEVEAMIFERNARSLYGL